MSVCDSAQKHLCGWFRAAAGASREGGRGGSGGLDPLSVAVSALLRRHGNGIKRPFPDVTPITKLKSCDSGPTRARSSFPLVSAFTTGPGWEGLGWGGMGGGHSSSLDLGGSSQRGKKNTGLSSLGGGGGVLSTLVVILRPCLSARKKGACLAEETHGADLEAKPLVGVAKVIQHDVDDGQLVDAGGVDLHHRL